MYYMNHAIKTHITFFFLTTLMNSLSLKLLCLSASLHMLWFLSLPHLFCRITSPGTLLLHFVRFYLFLLPLCFTQFPLCFVCFCGILLFIGVCVFKLLCVWPLRATIYLRHYSTLCQPHIFAIIISVNKVHFGHIDKDISCLPVWFFSTLLLPFWLHLNLHPVTFLHLCLLTSIPLLPLNPL